MRTFLILCMAAMLHTTTAATSSSTKNIKPSDDIIVRTYDIPSSQFNEIDVSSAANVNIIEGEGDIIVNIDSNVAEYLVIEVDGDELQIYLDYKKGVNDSYVFNVIIPCNTPINKISASGMAKITSKVVLTGDEIVVKASGMADILVMVRGEKCEVESSGMAEIEIAGKCNIFNIDATGSSEITAYTNSNECTAEVSGMSELSIDGEFKILTVEASGMSDVQVKGLTDSVKLKASGMSDVSASQLKYNNISILKSGMSDISYRKK